MGMEHTVITLGNLVQTTEWSAAKALGVVARTREQLPRAQQRLRVRSGNGPSPLGQATGDSIAHVFPPLTGGFASQHAARPSFDLRRPGRLHRGRIRSLRLIKARQQFRSDIGALLGHRNVRTTMIYTHVLPRGFSTRSPVDAL